MSLFFESSAKFSAKPAIIEGRQVVSYTQLSDEVRATAQYFLGRGISRGDRVLVLIPMSIDLYRNVLALFAIGAVAVFPEAWVNRERLEATVSSAGCSAMVGTFKLRLLSFLLPAIRKIPVRCKANPKLKRVNSFILQETKASDVALVTLTTGSTGTPKAVLRSHGALFEQFRALEEVIQPKSGDVDMPLLPVVLLINLAVGSTSVIARYHPAKPQSFKPGEILRIIEKHGVSRLIASPFFVKRLSEFILDHQLKQPGLKAIFTGGAPVFPAEASLYLKAFPQTRSTVVYGSTEAEPISTVDSEELVFAADNRVKGLNVGLVCAEVKVKIIRITDEPIVCKDEKQLEKRELPEGQIGEIIVSGKHVLNAYLNNPEAIARNKIRIGEIWWHRTGDSGFLEGGRLFLTGRCAALIIRSEKIVSPFVYEGLFQSIPGVVMGTIMDIGGCLAAAVELESAESPGTIEAKIQGAGVNFDRIVFLKRIPRDPRHYSKIDYEKLRNLLSTRI